MEATLYDVAAQRLSAPRQASGIWIRAIALTMK